MNYKKNILITGGSGFVGRHLLNETFLRGHNIRLITRQKENLLKQWYPDCEIYMADLNNKGQLLEATKEIDVIINAAAEVRNHSQLSITNIGGTENLIEAVVENKVKKVVHLSSVGVVGYQYSKTVVEITETSKCLPKNEYERTKLISENLLLEAQKKYSFSLDIVRPTNVFGENHPFNALLGLMNHIKSGKPCLSSKNAIVNYLYVKDLTSLIGLLAETEEGKGIINIGHSMILGDLYEYLKIILSSKNKILILPEFFIKILTNLNIKIFQSISNQVRYDDSKLLEFYSYKYGVEKGLEITAEDYKRKKLLK